MEIYGEKNPKLIGSEVVNIKKITIRSRRMRIGSSLV